jgi:hypothetical protein
MGHDVVPLRERKEGLIGHIALIPPTIYYSKVGLELAKLVAKDQKMALPYVFQIPFNLYTPTTCIY